MSFAKTMLHQSDLNFMSSKHITIVGILGKFGTVLTKRFSDSGFVVSGIDIRPVEGFTYADVLHKYHQIEADFTACDAVHNLIQDSDVLLLATPIESTHEAISILGRQLRSNALLVDIASVKSHAVASMLELTRTDIELLSLHPLFGPSVDFDGQNVIVIDVQPGPKSSELLSLFETWGCHLTKVSAAEHDIKMAFIQSLCHAVVISLGQTGKAQKLSADSLSSFMTPFSRPLLQLLDRIAKADPKLYATIQLVNPYSLSIIDEYLLQLSRFRELVANKNHDDLQGYFVDSISFLNEPTS